MSKWMKEAERNPVGMSLFSVLTKPLRYFSYLQQAEKTLSGETLDPTAGYNRGSYTANAIPGAVSREIENSGKWGKVGSYKKHPDDPFRIIRAGEGKPVRGLGCLEKRIRTSLLLSCCLSGSPPHPGANGVSGV